MIPPSPYIVLCPIRTHNTKLPRSRIDEHTQATTACRLGSPRSWPWVCGSCSRSHLPHLGRLLSHCLFWERPTRPDHSDSSAALGRSDRQLRATWAVESYPEFGQRPMAPHESAFATRHCMSPELTYIAPIGYSCSTRLTGNFPLMIEDDESHLTGDMSGGGSNVFEGANDRSRSCTRCITQRRGASYALWPGPRRCSRGRQRSTPIIVPSSKLTSSTPPHVSDLLVHSASQPRPPSLVASHH